MNSLIFVYNADSGLANALLDTGRRILKPQDYPCSLCLVTYGPFGMKRDWKDFTASLPYPVVFLHKNELSDSLQNELRDFPCLVLQRTKQTSVLIDGNEFRKIKDINTLKKNVITALNSTDSDLD
jgi:hypothetical protein